MKNTIKCKLSISNERDNRIRAEIIERNGILCNEVIDGAGSCGNHIAVCRDIVNNMEMDITNEKIITITIEE